jgi:hypothetical protein
MSQVSLGVFDLVAFVENAVSPTAGFKPTILGNKCCSNRVNRQFLPSRRHANGFDEPS